MNPIDPPHDERVLDELLSANLDGELAAAAADLGLTVEQARDTIASPAAVARRAALARASALAGTPVPLDPDVVDRLVTTAIAGGTTDGDISAARHRRERRAETARRVLVAAGSAAAVIAVIVGLASMSPSSNDSNSNAAVAPTESGDSSSRAANRAPVALGDVSGSEQLRLRVEAQLRRLPDPPKAPGYTPTSGATTAKPTSQAEGSANNDSAKALRSQVAACAPAARAMAGASAPVLSGRGVADGRPVNVYVFRRGEVYDVVVVGRDCSVVDRLALP